MMCTTIIWSFNLNLIFYIIFQAPLGASGKLAFFSYVYPAVFRGDGALPYLLIVVSLLFGVNAAMLAYVLQQRKSRAIDGRSGVAASIVALLSAGCVACGTSFFSPLLATIGATSAAAVRDFGVFMLAVSAALLLYSLYRLGLQSGSGDSQ